MSMMASKYTVYCTTQAAFERTQLIREILKLLKTLLSSYSLVSPDRTKKLFGRGSTWAVGTFWTSKRILNDAQSLNSPRPYFLCFFCVSEFCPQISGRTSECSKRSWCSSRFVRLYRLLDLWLDVAWWHLVSKTLDMKREIKSWQVKRRHWCH
jgi:hypothetical protein